MEVLISITGTQKLEGDEPQTMELTTAGRMDRTSDEYRVSYEEREDMGFPDTTTTVYIRPEEVRLERIGALNSLLVLHQGMRHSSSYATPYGSVLLGVYTRKLKQSITEQGGDLDMEYTMDMNAGMTSQHTLHMHIQAV